MRSEELRSALPVSYEQDIRSRILRIKRIFADWLIVVLTLFAPLTIVFWKGEFEGKNLFFKKGRRGAAPSPRYRARCIITAPVGRRRGAAPDPRCRAFANTRSRWSLFPLIVLNLKKLP